MSRIRAPLVLTLVALGPGAGWAGNAPPDAAADVELLEFLGSVDSGGDAQSAADDGSWMDYLARTDINKVAKAGDPNRAPPPPPPRPPPPPPPSPPPPGDKNEP
ncbi:MAG TPA: hypothetical protein VIY54_11630 [Steroidobacteraceae bacterium]